MMLKDLTNLRDMLKDPSLLATRAYVAGEWCDAGRARHADHP